MSEFTDLSAVQIAAGVRERRFRAAEVAAAHLEQIQRLEPALQAFLTICSDDAMRQAEALDARLDSGDTAGPLAGVVVALKDNLCTRGVRTTCGSRMLSQFVPPYNATAVERVLEADAIVIGKTNCDEFAMGSSTENSGYGPSRNPWDLERVPGGSSGGSAVAVAAGEATLALGSDTGGSIRQPASLCGIVGFKPTYGRVSRFGLVAYASSLDQIGPMARSVMDAALLSSVLFGKDVRDSTSVDLPVPDLVAACREGIAGLRVGVPTEFFAEGMDPLVAEGVRRAVAELSGLGARVEECSLPSVQHALAAYYILAPAEASSNLARYDGVKYGHRAQLNAGHVGLTERSREEGFGAEVKQRILVGTYALSAGYYDAFYRKAQQVRTLIRRDFEAAFQRFDVLAAPTSPTTAFRLGERSADPLAMKLADVCTLPVNLAGLPAISVPCGLVRNLPIGLQLIGRAYDEATLFQVAAAYERATEWHASRPSLAAVASKT